MVREGMITLNGFLRIDEALTSATQSLQGSSESPRLDAELLLARVLDVPRSYLFAHPEDCLDEAASIRFFAIIDKRLGGLPMAYITGEKEFWSMNLLVSPATLVPRPETEVLVEQALLRIPRNAALTVLDLGTGSGAIALAIARERTACHVTATDVSEAALLVARENARRLMLANVDFVSGSWCEPLAGRRFDIILSNPPYVAEGDAHLQNLRFEPLTALAAGEDGLDAIRQIAAQATDICAPGGWLMLEHGAEQAAAVALLLRQAGWGRIENATDLAGLPRVTSATT